MQPESGNLLISVLPLRPCRTIIRQCRPVCQSASEAGGPAPVPVCRLPVWLPHKDTRQQYRNRHGRRKYRRALPITCHTACASLGYAALLPRHPRQEKSARATCTPDHSPQQPERNGPKPVCPHRSRCVHESALRIEPFQLETLRVFSPPTACRCTGNAVFFRSVLAGRRCCRLEFCLFNENTL